MTKRLFAVRVFVCFIAGYAAASASDVSNWSTIPIPPNMTTEVNAIGTTASFQTTTGIQLYGGITKQWTFLPIQSLDFFQQFNAYIVLREGTQLYGFTSRTTGVDVITVSPSVQLFSGPTTSSWVTIAVDGTQAWGFSGFRGEWVPLTLSSPNPTIVASGLTAVLRDGATVYGFGAYGGSFVPVSADASAKLAVGGEVATAHSATVFRAFSPHQNTWGVQAFPSTTNVVLRTDFAMAYSGNQAVAFSGLAGNLATYSGTNPIAGVTSEAAVAGFFDGTTAVCYGAGQGAFGTLSTSLASISVDNEFLVVQETGKITPFSGVTSAFGPTLLGAFSFASNDVVGFVDSPTGVDYGYSPIRNDWTPVPSVTPVGSVALVRSAALVPHTSGYLAFSSRHGTWVPLATSVAGVFSAPANGGTIVCFDGPNVAQVFDARLNRFAEVASNSPLSVSSFRITAIANDGAKAWGFGQPSGYWDEVTLNSPPLGVDVASSIAVVETGTDIHVYCVQGSLSQEGRFPEFSRAVQLGNTLRLHQVAPAGSAVIMLLGTQPAYIDLGLLIGRLYIDPAGLLTLPLGTTVPANGLLDIDLALPQSPVLVGLQPQIQHAILPPSSQYYLTTSVSPVLY